MSFSHSLTFNSAVPSLSSQSSTQQTIQGSSPVKLVVSYCKSHHGAHYQAPDIFQKKVKSHVNAPGLSWENKFDDLGGVRFVGSQIALYLKVDGTIYKTKAQLESKLQELFRNFHKITNQNDSSISSVTFLQKQLSDVQEQQSSNLSDLLDLTQIKPEASHIDNNDLDWLSVQDDLTLNSVVQKSLLEYNQQQQDDTNSQLKNSQLRIKELEKIVEDQRNQIQSRDLKIQELDKKLSQMQTDKEREIIKQTDKEKEILKKTEEIEELKNKFRQSEEKIQELEAKLQKNQISQEQNLKIINNLQQDIVQIKKSVEDKNQRIKVLIGVQEYLLERQNQKQKYE